MSSPSTFAVLAAVVVAAAQGTITDRSLAGIPAGTLSPDGRLVSYFDTANREFRVDDVRSRQPVARLAISGYTGSSAISWDGTRVAFSAGLPGEGPGLRVLSLPASPGSAPRLLIKGADIDPREWSRDGTTILVGADLSPFEIRLVSAVDGSFRVLKQATSAARFLSPDGAFLAHARRVAGSGRNTVVGLLPTNGGVEIEVVEPTAWHQAVGWSSDGRQLVVLSDRGGFPGLWAIPIRDGRRDGEPRLLKRDFDGNPEAVTASGDVVYERVTGPPAARLVTAGIDSTGRATSAPVLYATHDPLAFARSPRWSPDGKSFLYVTGRLMGPAMVIHSTEKQDVREIPLELNRVFTFDWSPDGRSLIFKGTTLDGQFGQFCLCLMDVTTGRVTTAVPPGVYYHPRFSTSSTTVSYFKRQEEPVHWSYVERDLQSGVERNRVSDLSRLMAEPRSYPAGRSPDGRYLLAMVVGEPSRLMAYDTTTAEVREIFRAPGNQAFNHYGDLQWTPDSRAIVTTVATVVHAAGNEQEIWWIPIDGRAPRKIDVGTTQIGENPIAIHPDGTRIAFVAGRPFPAVWTANVRPQAIGAPVELRLLGNVVP